MSLDFLPKELEDIIYDYKKQLENTDLLEISNCIDLRISGMNGGIHLIRAEIVKKEVSTIVKVYNKLNDFNRKHPSYIKVKDAKNKPNDFRETIFKYFGIPTNSININEYTKFDSLKFLRMGYEHNTIRRKLNLSNADELYLLNHIMEKEINLINGYKTCKRNSKKIHQSGLHNHVDCQSSLEMYDELINNANRRYENAKRELRELQLQL